MLPQQFMDKVRAQVSDVITDLFVYRDQPGRLDPVAVEQRICNRIFKIAEQAVKHAEAMGTTEQELKQARSTLSKLKKEATEVRKMKQKLDSQLRASKYDGFREEIGNNKATSHLGIQSHPDLIT